MKFPNSFHMLNTSYKLILSVSFFLGLCPVSFAQQTEPCIAHTIYQQMLERDPQFKANQEALEMETQIASNQSGRSASSVPRIIPVVFHIIHEYGTENISRQQCLNQLEILNKDFRRLNADTGNTPAPFKPIAGDANIEFRLAQKDPNGNCTDGVNRLYSPLTNNARDNVKSLIYWPSSKYLNIWVVKSIESSSAGTGYVIGFAQFPGGNAATDGVVLRADFVGAIGTSNASNAGRTATHEVGHWLNLRHIWGDATCGNDNVSDTPTHEAANQSNCPAFPKISCNNGPNGEMFTNYMDYTNGDCQNVFSAGQATRMNAALSSNVSGRSTLWSSANLAATGTDGTPPTTCAPRADFTPNLPTYLCAGGSVTFTQTCFGGDATGYSWTFQGGTPSTSTASSPVVTYSTPGTYNVSLTASNAVGNNTLTRSALVVVMPAAAEYSGPVFQEGFEDASQFTNDWTVFNNVSGTATFARVTNTSASGSACVKMDNFNSSDLQVDELIGPTIDLTTISVPTLTYKVAYAQKTTSASSSNRLQILVSQNCGRTWAIRSTATGNTLATTTAVNTAFTPSSTSWATRTINLTPNISANFRFKFVFTSGDGNNLYLDDINISSATTGWETMSGVSDALAFPNPAEGAFDFTFSLEESNQATLGVLNALGEQVEYRDLGRLSPGRHTLNQLGEGLKSGMYFVRLFTPGGSVVRKVVVR